MVFVIGRSGSDFHEPYRSEKNGIDEYAGDDCGNDYSGFVDYNLYTCLMAFALLGIGNTILQVLILNPLLTNVVKGKRVGKFIDGRTGVESRFFFLWPVYRGICGQPNWGIGNICSRFLRC